VIEVANRGHETNMKWIPSSVLFSTLFLPCVACGGAPDGSADTSRTSLAMTSSDGAGVPGESEDAGAPDEALDAGAPPVAVDAGDGKGHEHGPGCGDDDAGVPVGEDAGAPVDEDAGVPVGEDGGDDAGVPVGDDEDEDAGYPRATVDAGAVVTVAPRG
jgi:hypothetical protein